MKILIVTGIFPPDIGGPATYVPKMAFALGERGHQVEVLTLSDVDTDEVDRKLQVHRVPRDLWLPRRWLRTIWRIFFAARGTDIVFVNGLQTEAAIALTFARRRAIMKVVGDWAWERSVARGWTSASFEEFDASPDVGWKVRLQRILRSWSLRSMKVVITPSEYLARHVRAWGMPRERVRVVFNAFEHREPGAAAVPLKTSLKAVTVSRLVPWKRVDGIIRALSKLPDLGLVVVGDGPERGRLDRLVHELSLEDRVYFAGVRPQRETLGLMSLCDLFVLNSTYEGLPHVVLEAISLGLPVVATDAGGTSEVLGHGGGLLIGLHDSDLVRALDDVCSDADLRDRLKESGRKALQDEFQFDRMVERTEEILLEAAGAQRG